ncbi:MAG: hypothetical protein CVT99_13505 [Bacteroidetes bacterium HGW-Bacteroidetes-16]|jgi:DNA-binding CsgD family transcriptional regulator|nr:MAG: hypothetical protein CVT99_13505 [Bacteroidetes bacterium HGW-Bacteroidetes-16]
METWDIANKHAESIAKLFPDQIKVFDLKKIKKCDAVDAPTFLHKHIREPLTKEIWETLIWEVVDFLMTNKMHNVYCFFYRQKNDEFSEVIWTLSCAKLNIDDKGIPDEMVVFSYDLKLLGEKSKRLYRVLENDEFIKENFNKVSSLTRREKEIIQLLASGMSSPEIANSVFLSVHTVNTHRKNIINKLHIKNFSGLLKYVDLFDLNTTNIISL